MDTYFNIKNGEMIIFADSNKVYEEEEIKDAFAKSLKEIRAYAKLSLKEVATATKIPIATISAYENGTRIPSFLFAMKIASFFGSTIEDFVLNGLTENIETGGDIYAKYDFLHDENS